MFVLPVRIVLLRLLLFYHFLVLRLDPVVIVATGRTLLIVIFSLFVCDWSMIT
jgi:hypothetical protein